MRFWAAVIQKGIYWLLKPSDPYCIVAACYGTIGLLMPLDRRVLQGYHLFSLSVSSYLSHRRGNTTPPAAAMNSIKPNNENASVAAPMKLGGNTTSTVLCPKEPSARSKESPIDCSVPTTQVQTYNTFDPESLLAVGEVLLISENYKGLQVPSDFWSAEQTLFSPAVQQLIERDFDW